MAGERYYFKTPNGREPLNGSYRPSGSNRSYSPNLVRGWAQTEIHDLADGLPDPKPLTLVGREKRDSEEELQAWLQELEAMLRSSTEYDRDGRKPQMVKAVYLTWNEAGDNSAEVETQIVVIPTHVPTFNAADVYSS